jgi:RNA polymerase sigma factor (sigma-70 family)
MSSDNTSLESSIQVTEAKKALANAHKLVFDSLYGSLYKTAIETTKEPESAKDILSESLLALIEEGIEKTLKFEPIQNFLLNYVRNACDNYLKEKQLFELIQTTHIGNILDDTAGPEEKEIIAALIDAYEKLPAYRKAILKDTLINDTPSDKVASKYKINVKKVLNINSYTLKLLRKALFNKFQ